MVNSHLARKYISLNEGAKVMKKEKRVCSYSISNSSIKYQPTDYLIDAMVYSKHSLESSHFICETGREEQEEEEDEKAE